MRLDDFLDRRPGVQLLAGGHGEAILDRLGALGMKVRERVPWRRRVVGTPDWELGPKHTTPRTMGRTLCTDTLTGLVGISDMSPR